MLKLLLVQRLGAIKSWLLGAGRRKKNAGPGQLVLYALLMLYAACAIAFMLFASIFSVIADPFLRWASDGFILPCSCSSISDLCL